MVTTRLTRSAWSAAGCTLVLLLAAGCAGDEPTTAEPQSTATAEPALQDAEPKSTTTSGSAFRTPKPAFVSYDDPSRPLTELEQSLLRKPGSFAGDDYDQEKVIEAARALNPSTAQQWSKAILAQIHGRYAEDIKATVRFDPSIDESPDQPSEESPEDGQDTVGTNHFALVLDASGSMAAKSATGTRMAEAKEALTDFVGILPPESTVSLRVYGHKGSNAAADKAESCASSEMIYQGMADDGAFAENLRSLEPTGWTPLAAPSRTPPPTSRLMQPTGSCMS